MSGGGFRQHGGFGSNQWLTHYLEIKEKLMARTITNEYCGFCEADLRGGIIPPQYIEEGLYGNKDPSKPHYYSQRIGVEYPYGHPGRYDGVSEWRCPACGVRVGRWSGRVLLGNDYERPFGRETR